MEADIARETDEGHRPIVIEYPVPVTERDKNIVALTMQGMSAKTVGEKLGLSLSSERIGAIARKHLGRAKEGNNSRAFAIGPNMMPYVKEALRRLGKDPTTCEICGAQPKRGCIIHHTKYEGCTIYDLMYICTSCNLSRMNKGLS